MHISKGKRCKKFKNVLVLCISCIAFSALFSATLFSNGISIQQFRSALSSSSSNTQDPVTIVLTTKPTVDSTSYNRKSLLNRGNQALGDKFENPSINSFDNSNDAYKIDSSLKESLPIITFEFDFVCRDYNQFCQKSDYSCQDILDYISMSKNSYADVEVKLLTNDRFYFLSLRRDIIFNILRVYNYNYKKGIEMIENDVQLSCIRRLLLELSFLNNNYYHDHDHNDHYINYSNPRTMYDDTSSNDDVNFYHNYSQPTKSQTQSQIQSSAALSKWNVIHISKNGGTTMRSTFEQAVKLYNTQQTNGVVDEINYKFKAHCNGCVDILRGVEQDDIANCQCDAMMQEMNKNNIQICSNERPLISDAICRNMRNLVVIREPIEHVLSYLFVRTWYGGTNIKCICKEKRCLNIKLPEIDVVESLNGDSIKKSQISQKNVTFGKFYNCDSVSNSLRYFIKDIIGFVNILDSKSHFNQTIDNKIKNIFSKSPETFILPNMIAKNLDSSTTNDDHETVDEIEWEIDWNVSNSHFGYRLITQKNTFNYYQLSKNYFAWLNNLQTRYFGISEIPPLILHSNSNSNLNYKTRTLDKSTSKMLYLTGKNVNQEMAQEMIANCQKILLAIDYVMPMQNYRYAKETTFDLYAVDKQTIKENWEYTLQQVKMSLNITGLEWISENKQSNRYVPGKTHLKSKSIFDSLTQFEKNLLYQYNKLDTQLFQFAMKIAMADNLFYYFQDKQ